MKINRLILFYSITGEYTIAKCDQITVPDQIFPYVIDK